MFGNAQTGRSAYMKMHAVGGSQLCRDTAPMMARRSLPTLHALTRKHPSKLTNVIDDQGYSAGELDAVDLAELVGRSVAALTRRLRLDCVELPLPAADEVGDPASPHAVLNGHVEPRPLRLQELPDRRFYSTFRSHRGAGAVSSLILARHSPASRPVRMPVSAVLWICSSSEL
jgi:hypothetical protein